MKAAPVSALNLRLPKSLDLAIRIEAARRDISRSELVRLACIELLSKAQSEQAELEEEKEKTK